MKWIGLTGGIATGKSTVSRILVESGCPVVDADQLAREVVAVGSPGLLKTVEEFGTDILLDDGQLDRKKLGQLIFSNPEKRARLEKIIHPLVRALAKQKRNDLERAGYSLAFYDVPLLFEKQMQSQFDIIVVVGCSAELQVKRLMEREGLTKDEADRRVQSQISISDKIKWANEVLDNSGTIENLRAQVKDLLKRLGESETKKNKSAT